MGKKKQVELYTCFQLLFSLFTSCLFSVWPELLHLTLYLVNKHNKISLLNKLLSI